MFFALVALAVLLVAGRVMGELPWARIGVCLGFAAVVFVVFAAFGWPFNIYTVLITVMDIVLVFFIFKGDVRIR